VLNINNKRIKTRSDNIVMEDITQPAIQRSKRDRDAENSGNYRIRERAREDEVCRGLEERAHCEYIYICVLVSDLAHNCYLVLYFNPPFVIREAILSGQLQPDQVATFYQTLQGLEDQHEKLFVKLKSTDEKRFHFSRQTLGMFGTDEGLQERILEEAERLVAPIVRNLQEKLDRHTVADVSVLMSEDGARSQVKHKDWASKDLDHLGPNQKPTSLIIPVNDYCVLNIYDDHGELVVLQRVGVGFYAQFRGDTLHAGGANPLKRKQYRIHIYLTTPDTPVPADEVYLVSG